MIALAKKTDNEILESVEPLIERMLAGSTERNHEKHVTDFTDRLKVIVTIDNLAQQCEDYQAHVGYFKKREFVAVFRRQLSVAVVWRLCFTKSDDEFVLEAVFVEKESALKIDHCMIY